MSVPDSEDLAALIDSYDPEIMEAVRQGQAEIDRGEIILDSVVK